MAKLNKKQENRTLHVVRDEQGFVLIEREKSTWYGKNRWNDTRVFITRDEVRRLAEFAENNPPEVPQ